MLDNNDFDVTFIFNPDGTLRYVSLLRSFGDYRNEMDQVPISTISSAAVSLSDLLASKYGQAVKDAPSGFLSKERLLEMEWQPGRGASWKSGGDRVALRAEATESKKNPGLYRGSIQIFYTFTREVELNRL